MKTTESKVSKVITKGTIVRETDTHVFKIDNVDLDNISEMPVGLTGTIFHKTGSKCGDFVINYFDRKMLSVNIDITCRTLLADLLSMIDDMLAGNVTPVDEFTYVKNGSSLEQPDILEAYVLDALD